MTPIADRVIEIQGLGFILFSPFTVRYLVFGQDYFSQHYKEDAQVEEHIRSGTIVGFCTQSSGIYRVKVYNGYPDKHHLESRPFKLRLGVEVRDNLLCIRDLYDLMDWVPACPDNQQIRLENGFFHVTLLSLPPQSGVIGDNQLIDMFLHKLDTPEMPAIALSGVPNLYWTEAEKPSGY